jgi:hypothetical protein
VLESTVIFPLGEYSSLMIACGPGPRGIEHVENYCFAIMFLKHPSCWRVPASVIARIRAGLCDTNKYIRRIACICESQVELTDY